MSRRIHRVTGDSKAGRQLRSQNSRPAPHVELTAEQKAWNERVERERAEKKVRKHGSA